MNFGFSRLFCLALIVLLSPSAFCADSRAQEKVLRYAFEIAETGFDPAQISDFYSRTATENMFDALYRYDYLARPAKVLPNVAQGMPAISEDFKTFTIKEGDRVEFIHPSFGG